MSESKAYFSYTSPHHRSGEVLILCRKEQWPRGWDGGIVIDHAMGWKKPEKGGKEEGKRQPDESFINSSPAVDCIHRILIFAFTNCRASVWLSFRTPAQRILGLVVGVRAFRGFIYFAVDFNFSSFSFILRVLLFVCDAAFDEADEAQRKCWRKLKSKLIAIYMILRNLQRSSLKVSQKNWLLTKVVTICVSNKHKIRTIFEKVYPPLNLLNLLRLA